jgi:NIPSNAP protein
MPTDFAGATNEAIGLIDFPSLAEYEIYRAELAAHPLHKKYVEVLESTYQRANNRSGFRLF